MDKKIIDICKKRSVFTKDLQKVADIFFKPVVITDKKVIPVFSKFQSIFLKFKITNFT